jgi:diadenosine tetraphosphate (Ap4A) HIT family hydrolase
MLVTREWPSTGSCNFCPISEPGVYSSDGLDVVPSVGSLTEGWLLIVPRAHVPATAALARDQYVEVTAALHKMEARLQETFGLPTVIFEHGPAAFGRTAGCGVDHAHLHIVPTNVDLISEATMLFPELQFAAANDEDVRQAHERGNDYLYLRDQGGNAWFAEAASLPSQVFRRCIASAIGLANWDWKADSRPEVSRKTLISLTER